MTMRKVRSTIPPGISPLRAFALVVTCSIAAAAADEPRDRLDVVSYRLSATIAPAAGTIRGVATTVVRLRSDAPSLHVHLAPALAVSEASVGDRPASVARNGDDLLLTPSGGLKGGVEVPITIAFAGSPAKDGTFAFGEHAGVRVAASYGLPYSARDWWPTIDEPWAKARSADLQFTVPHDSIAVSNGKLQGRRDNPDGTQTFHWVVDDPIYADVVSVAVANYVRFSGEATSAAARIPLEFYVYPDHLAAAQRQFAVVGAMLEYEAGVFGPYPFARAKYGIVEFPVASFREHQTIPSLGSRFITGTSQFDRILAHDLAHQWFGNAVTVHDWSDAWLNEGFATYASVLWAEHNGGAPALKAEMDRLDVMNPANPTGRIGEFAGSVFVRNPASDPELLGNTTFFKGAWVLHMLRFVLGDDAFFRTLRTYVARFNGATATTQDFRRVCEETSGRDLGWFFEEWVYGTGRPAYRVSFRSVANGVRVRIEQTQTGRTFRMPLDLALTTPHGILTRRVDNDRSNQEVAVVTTDSVTAVTLDPGEHVLKKIDGG